MANAEQSHAKGTELLPELVPLRQCLTELDLVSDVRQAVNKALARSEELLRQRLEQMARHAERGALVRSALDVEGPVMGRDNFAHHV